MYKKAILHAYISENYLKGGTKHQYHRQFKKKSSTENIGPIMKLAILTIGTILLAFSSNKVGASK